MEKSIIETLIKNIIHLKDFRFVEIFDDVNHPIGSELILKKDKLVPITYQNMGATIIDAVLQAGMNYKNVVKPRVDQFRTDYPYCKTTKDFLNILQNKSISKLINWKGRVKIDRIEQLTSFLDRHNIQTEVDLQTWLRNAENCLMVQKIKGIKEKTIDYLKILSGDTSTIAVDVHLKKFITVYGEIQYDLNYEKAKEILLRTAKRLNVSPATLDYSIWKFMSK